MHFKSLHFHSFIHSFISFIHRSEVSGGRMITDPQALLLIFEEKPFCRRSTPLCSANGKMT